MAKRRRARGTVIRYRGARGVVWRIKYRDGDGRQVMETLGRETDGWDEDRARDTLEERLHAVRQRGYRPPKPVTFEAWADEWLEHGARLDGWKPRTTAAYQVVVRRLKQHFGSKRLTAVRPRDAAAYVRRHAETLSPATLNRDLSILHAIFEAARRDELVEANPADNVRRPKLPPFRPRVLKPAEIQAVLHAFAEVAREVAAAPVTTVQEIAWRRGQQLRWEQARVVFLTLVLTGLRRFELQALRWRDVDLVANELRVVDSKSEDGIRAIALPRSLAEELWQHRRRSAYQGDDERVFCHPERGTPLSAEQWRPVFEQVLARAEIRGHVRPFHDLRHTAITNDAAAGSSTIAIKVKAGHASFRTTERYIHLAGVVFHDEAQRLEERVLGRSFYPPSTDLSEPEAIEHDPGARGDVLASLSDA